jgi:hypothetical protein
MIGNYASTKGSLDGFSLNLEELVKRLTPTTEYFGKLNEQTLEFTETNITPDDNHTTLTVTSLPMRMGCRQLDTPSYPSRPFYTLEFNDEKIEDWVRGRMEDDSDIGDVRRTVEIEKEKISRRMPLKVVVEREYYENKELLRIDSVTDRNGDDLSINRFRLQVQSMSEMEDFWLDSGIFTLKTNVHQN